jgi:hypothetical protein
MSSVSMIPCPRLYSPGRILFSHKICMTPMCCSCLFVWSHGSQHRKTDEVMEVSTEKTMKSWKSEWSHGSQYRKTGFDGHRHSILYVPHELRYDVVVEPLCVRSQTDVQGFVEVGAKVLNETHDILDQWRSFLIQSGRIDFTTLEVRIDFTTLESTSGFESRVVTRTMTDHDEYLSSPMHIARYRRKAILWKVVTWRQIKKTKNEHFDKCTLFRSEHVHVHVQWWTDGHFREINLTESPGWVQCIPHRYDTGPMGGSVWLWRPWRVARE